MTARRDEVDAVASVNHVAKAMAKVDGHPHVWMGYRPWWRKVRNELLRAGLTVSLKPKARKGSR